MMKIYGAGMAGLIAAHMFRRYDPEVYEIQKSLPNNHEALLRFRTDAVSRVTGIPFKKVLVRKSIFYHNSIINNCTIPLANEYSQKVSGAIESRSIWNLDPVERYIAPPNFIEQLAKGIKINYGFALERGHYQNSCPNINYKPAISTIPMPVLMDSFGWDKCEFNYRTITSISCELNLNCDVYQTIYFPEKGKEAYRASMTGNKFILEFVNPPEFSDNLTKSVISYYLLRFFGIDCEDDDLSNISTKKHKFGKIVNNNQKETQAFIMAMTDNYNIYSLGRFATWRQLLLDDMVKDCKVIEKLIETKDTYQAKVR